MKIESDDEISRLLVKEGYSYMGPNKDLEDLGDLEDLEDFEILRIF